jgi:hypothetical protein
VILVMDDLRHLNCDLVKSFGHFESWGNSTTKKPGVSEEMSSARRRTDAWLTGFAPRQQECGGLDRMHTHCIHTPNQALMYHMSKVDSISIVADDRYTSVVI